VRNKRANLRKAPSSCARELPIHQILAITMTAPSTALKVGEALLTALARMLQLATHAGKALAAGGFVF
jgi:hypothetical protein